MRRESNGKIFICKPTHLSGRREYKKQDHYNFIGNIDIQKKRAESRKLPALFFRLYHSSLWHMNEFPVFYFVIKLINQRQQCIGGKTDVIGYDETKNGKN